MNICKCGKPVEDVQYKFCKPCWWAQDLRNPINKKPLKKFRVKVIRTTHLIYEVSAENKSEALHMIQYGRAIALKENTFFKTIIPRKIK